MIGQPEPEAVVESPVASDNNDNDDRENDDQESHSGNDEGPPSNDGEGEGSELDGSEVGGSEVGSLDATEFPHAYAETDSDSDGCDASPRSYDSNLSKKTLELGGSPASPPRDSQVSSGWLGKAYNEESRRMKKQQTLEKLVQVWVSKSSVSLRIT